MNEIIQGDCLEAMAGLEDNSVDLICAKSPAPYRFQPFLGYNKRAGQCLQHPRNGNLVSVGHMNNLHDYEQLSLSLQISQPNLRKPKTVRLSIFYKCERCQKEFHPKHKGSRFCSKKCNIRSRPNRLLPRICLQCNAEYKPQSKGAKYCSRACFSESHKSRMLGASNPSWLDGRSYDKRCHRGQDWETQRKAAYERDQYKCQHCGVKCVGRRAMTEENAHKLIQCHHIVFWKDGQDNSLSNLVTLCVSCHAKVHFGSTDINE